MLTWGGPGNAMDVARMRNYVAVALLLPSYLSMLLDFSISEASQQLPIPGGIGSVPNSLMEPT